MFEDFYKKYKEDIKNCFKDLKDKDKRIKQIPNLLTSIRLLAPIPFNILYHYYCST